MHSCHYSSLLQCEAVVATAAVAVAEAAAVRPEVASCTDSISLRIFACVALRLLAVALIWMMTTMIEMWPPLARSQLRTASSVDL